MAARLLQFERPIRIEEVLPVQGPMFGKKIGIVAGLFGCNHKALSRPFSHGSVGYRTCLQCGARKKFDLETRTTSTDAYYPPPAAA